MAKYIRFPWAVNGDRQPIPDAAAGGNVSYQAGYTPDYSLPKTDPNRKSIGRQPFNQALNDLTANIKEWQEQIYPEFIADDGLGNVYSYPKTAVVRFNEVYYQAVVDGTTTAPPSAEWRVFAFDSEATADTVPVRDTGGTFKVGAPTDPAHPVRKQEFDAQTSVLQWLGTAVAETKTLMSSNTALYPPTDSSLFRYILLSEGLDGAGQYNEGILINETITGSGVERQVTAEINFPDSPLHGQVIHLINSERSHLRPGETAGVFEQDQMQRITGVMGFFRGEASQRIGFRPSVEGGALSRGGEGVSRSFATEPSVSPWSSEMFFNSSNSPDARTSAATNGETRVKSVSAIYFLRVA